MPSIMQIAFLLGAVVLFAASSGAQKCDVSGVPAVADLDINRFIGKYWYLQEIIVRNASELENSTVSCFRQTATHSAMGHYDITDQWTNTTTGEEDFLYGIMELNEENPASWNVIWFQSFYTGVWTHTDYDNYAIQYYCPEDLHYHPESMLLWTRSPTPDPLMLDLLEIIAEGQEGFSKENAIKIDNSMC